MGALEARLSSEPRFGDGLTFDLVLHLPPLLSGQQEVQMLSGDILTACVLLDTEIYRNLTGQIRLRISFNIRKRFEEEISLSHRKHTFEGTYHRIIILGFCFGKWVECLELNLHLRLRLKSVMSSM